MNIKLAGTYSEIHANIERGKLRKLPNLFYIGPSRSGSTSFFGYCDKSKDIFTPGLKETNFLTCFDRRFVGPGEQSIFHSGINFPAFSRGEKQHCSITSSISDYIALYDDRKSEKWAVDISPSYSFYFDLFLKNVENICADPAIVFLPRDPVSRALSNYKSVFGRKGPETILETYSYEINRLKRGWEFYWSISGQGQYSEIVRHLNYGGYNAFISTYENIYQNDGLKLLSDFLRIDGVEKADHANQTKSVGFIELVDLGDLILDVGAPTQAYLDQIKHSESARKRVSIAEGQGWSANLEPATIRNLVRPYIADIIQLTHIDHLRDRVADWETYKSIVNVGLMR
ncbi:sulfotransferase [Nitratireductor sp. B36]|uniref:sulfotransferase n=1 Tax=Nitratireductor sp. B36 TaxID=2762059 RepID=UPI001E5454E1|nr:sulfotransferase [Nitratireductor sp. B36]MCC5778461.1 sulfotransferase [Nitratireductor sp. B36]